jgi:hypothetical protein
MSLGVELSSCNGIPLPMNKNDYSEQLYLNAFKADTKNRAAKAWHELLLTRDDEHR